MKKFTDKQTISILPGKENEGVYVTTSISNGDFGGAYIIARETGKIINKGLGKHFLGTGSQLKGKTRAVTNNVFDLRPFGNTQAVHAVSGDAVAALQNVYNHVSDDGVVVIEVEYTFQ